MIKKKGVGQIMSENIKDINTDKNCKKQGKTPKNVRENVILKSRKKEIKKQGKGQNMSENFDLVMIG